MQEVMFGINMSGDVRKDVRYGDGQDIGCPVPVIVKKAGGAKVE
ncbi:hypothetical protein [Sanguibacteroides justesenii]|nr:hypothetical protein [Sanguibacteroides justesenii]